MKLRYPAKVAALLAAAFLLMLFASTAFGYADRWTLIDARRVDGPTPGWLCTYERGYSRFVQFQLSYCSSTPQ